MAHLVLPDTQNRPFAKPKEPLFANAPKQNLTEIKPTSQNILPIFDFIFTMKSIFVTILLLLYLIPTFGINVTVHYCGGKISNIAFGTVTKDTCACGSKKMKKNCCEDKTFSFEVDDDQAKTPESILTFTNSLNFDIALPQSFEFSYAFCPVIVSTDYFHHPPNNVKQPLYILNQVFRI